MIHFNSHKPGFSFIEIMIAIMLLAIFGTSLFMTQTKILSTISKTHNKVINAFQYAASIPELITKKIDTKKQNKSFDTITINKQIKYPQMSIQTSVKKIPEKSELFKDFKNSLMLVNQTITRDDKKNLMISFLFTPPIEKKEETMAKDVAKSIAKEQPATPKGGA